MGDTSTVPGRGGRVGRGRRVSEQGDRPQAGQGLTFAGGLNRPRLCRFLPLDFAELSRGARRDRAPGSR